MTVEKLIKELKKFDKKSKVLVASDIGIYPIKVKNVSKSTDYLNGTYTSINIEETGT